MRASDFRLALSPSNPTAVRASASVHFENPRWPAETWWMEVPRAHRDQVCLTGEPWMVMLLPLAFSLGEPIELALPVESKFLNSLQRVMAIWSSWYPQFRPIVLAAPTAAEERAKPGRLVGAFFSGGVDSTYSVIHHDQQSISRVEELIFVRGFDIHLSKDAALAAAEDRVRRMAAKLGKPLITIATNLRDTRLREANWEKMAHATVLAALGLMLSRRYRQVLIGSAVPADMKRPLGSHPAVYPNLSTRSTEIALDAADTTRSTKIAALCKRPDLLDDLRVCWEAEAGDNCGRCAKCLYTMATLEIHGALANSGAFPDTQLDHGRLRSTFTGRKDYYFEDVRDAARGLGRTDVADSLEAAIAMSNRLRRWLLLDLVTPLFERLRFNPALRRLTGPLRPIVWHSLRRLARVLGSLCGR